MKKIILLVITIHISASFFGQEGMNNRADTLRKDALNVYYPDASSYLKEEIPFINYVRDRKFADLIIISTSQATGSGGTRYTYFLEGQGKYSNMKDTLDFSSSPDDTYEMIRAKRIKMMKLGLIRYVSKTPLHEFIKINFTEPMTEEVSTDKWNSWVFSTSLYGFAFASESSDYFDLSSSVSSSRVTKDFKLELNGGYSVTVREMRWTNPDTELEESETNRNVTSYIGGLAVKSINEHWSAGIISSISSSIFHNYIAHFVFQPGLEYNIYPFSQSTSKQFRFMYAIGPVYNNYCDTTKFFKKNEVVGQQGLYAAYKNIKKWGDFNISTSWENYLHDWDLNRLSFSSSISLRVAKGLRISLSGSYSFIHDQINLRKGTASTSDVLLSRKEMATTYSYDAYVSISYTFGSIYNNVVNPRFTRSGGSSVIIF